MNDYGMTQRCQRSQVETIEEPKYVLTADISIMPEIVVETIMKNLTTDLKR
jgi:hypothetical protein